MVPLGIRRKQSSQPMNERDPRIDWHMKFCRDRHLTEVSELAIKLALTACERGNTDAGHEWEARNAVRFQAVLNQNGGLLMDSNQKRPASKSAQAVDNMVPGGRVELPTKGL